MSKTLENGSFQDPVGTVVNAGTIEFVLSHDAMIIAGGQVAPTRVTATLSSTGDMPANFTILANDELTPSGTFYLTTVFDSNGARVFGPERWVFSGTSPIDLDTMTPTIVDPAFADPILANPVASQTITGFPLITDISTAASVSSNALRLLFSDTAGSVLTGTTTETDLWSTNIAAKTIGTTGALMVFAEGAMTNVSGGSKTVRLKFDGTTIITISRTGSNNQNWLFWGFIFNRTTTTQTIAFCRSTADAITIDFDRTTSSKDTTTGLNLKLTGSLGNANDTISPGVFKVFLVQPV